MNNVLNKIDHSKVIDKYLIKLGTMHYRGINLNIVESRIACYLVKLLKYIDADLNSLILPDSINTNELCYQLSNEIFNIRPILFINKIEPNLNLGTISKNRLSKSHALINFSKLAIQENEFGLFTFIFPSTCITNYIIRSRITH